MWLLRVKYSVGSELHTPVLGRARLPMHPTARRLIVHVPAKDDPSRSAGESPVKFEVEYRWEKIPEEDEEAAVWLVFVLCLLLTVVVMVEVYNSFDERVEDRSR